MISNDARRIMIVDEHPIVREGLTKRLSLRPRFLICGEAEGEDEAMLTAKEMSPHLVIVDISLKQGHGIELIKRIHAKYPKIKILVYSGFADSKYAERALRAGADGYLNKGQPTDRLEDAVTAILNGHRYISDVISRRLLEQQIDGQSEVDRVRCLSNRELQVFELLGEGMTSRAIATKLHLSPHTIDTHRENIKRKLNLQTSSELTRFAIHWSMDSERSPS